MLHPLFTPEHEELRAFVRKFVESEFAPHAVEWEEDGDFPDWTFKRMGELGLLGLRYPPEFGGQGGDWGHAIVLAEELARSGCGGLGMALAVQSEMATPPIAKFGTDEQKEKYLGPAIRGEKIASLGISEPNAGSDVANIETVAVQDGDDWVINGRKIFITNGVRADFITLVTRTNKAEGYDGFSLFLVDKDTPGFTVSRKLDKLGMRASDTAELAFDDVRVPGSALLGTEGKGFYQIMWELQGERLIGVAGSVAGSILALRRTIEYCKERTAFGQPIGSFQHNRFKLAEMRTEIDLGQVFVDRQVEALNAGELTAEDAAEGKWWCTEMAWRTLDTCLQLHGGYGYMEEYPIARAWRDGRIPTIYGGPTEIMKEIIGRSLGL